MCRYQIFGNHKAKILTLKFTGDKTLDIVTMVPFGSRLAIYPRFKKNAMGLTSWLFSGGQFCLYSGEENLVLWHLKDSRLLSGIKVRPMF